jgi:hypothetical protein
LTTRFRCLAMAPSLDECQGDEGAGSSRLASAGERDEILE